MMMIDGSTAPDSVGCARAGFSLVEVIIALLILAVGLLAMAATTGYLSRQIRQSDFRTERAVATRNATERLRTISYNDLDSKPLSDAWTYGEYEIYWNVENEGSLKEIEMISRGPGIGPNGGVRPTVEDTTSFSAAQSVWN